jgi:DNA polymerase-3 subunit epsilon
MENFAAIDFETANNERTSICSVGIVIVRNGKIVDSFYSLIQPEPNYYCYWNTQVHGLTRKDTDDAPVFPKVWKQIAPMIEATRKERKTFPWCTFRFNRQGGRSTTDSC